MNALLISVRPVKVNKHIFFLFVCVVSFQCTPEEIVKWQYCEMLSVRRYPDIDDCETSVACEFNLFFLSFFFLLHQCEIWQHTEHTVADIQNSHPFESNVIILTIVCTNGMGWWWSCDDSTKTKKEKCAFPLLWWRIYSPIFVSVAFNVNFSLFHCLHWMRRLQTMTTWQRSNSGCVSGPSGWCSI